MRQVGRQHRHANQDAARNGIAQGALPPDGIDLAEWERSLIAQALQEAGGNQTKAAKKLGISRDTLRYRLKKFGINT